MKTAIAVVLVVLVVVLLVLVVVLLVVLQGSYRSWRVLEFKSYIFAGLESPGIRPGSGKSCQSE